MAQSEAWTLGDGGRFTDSNAQDDPPEHKEEGGGVSESWSGTSS